MIFAILAACYEPLPHPRRHSPSEDLYNDKMRKANHPLPSQFSLRTIFLITTLICICLGGTFFSIRIVSGLLGWLYTALVILGALILVQYPLFLLFRNYLPTEEEDELET